MSGTTTATGAARAAPIAGQTRWRQALIAWSFALPFLILFAIFMLLPIVAAAVTSFTDLTSRDIRNPLSVEFIGVENYVNVLTDPKFHKAAGNTVVYVLVGVPLTMALGLLAAVGLNQGVVKLRTLFRVGYYLPVVTSIVAVAVVWRLLLGTDTGLINGLLSTIGVDGPGWLTDERFALWSVMAMAIWRGIGFLMIIFLAGLQTIPEDLYEAAKVDGAGRLQRFWGITVPIDAAHPALRRGDHCHRVGPVLRRGLRHDPGRAAQCHAVGRLPGVQPVQLRQLRLHGRDGVHPVHRDRGD